MKKLCSVLLCFLLVAHVFLMLAPQGAATVFTDVNQSSMDIEVYEAIMYVSDNGYMVGTTNTTFSPDTILTRAQAVAILYRMAGSPTANYSIPFTDVSPSSYYYSAVCWAYHFEITFGSTPTTFSPHDQLKLQEAIAFLYRYACLTQTFSIDPTLIQSFSDYSNISAYARTAMNWAAQYCIVQPDSNNMVYPKSYLSRAKKALFICRYDKNTVGFFDGKKKFDFLNHSATNQLSGSTKARLFSCIRSHFSEEQAEEILMRIRPKLSQSAGKCFGISCAMLFDAIGRIDFNQNVGGYYSMHDVPDYLTDDTVLDGINFFKLGEFAAMYSKQKVNTTQKFYDMYNEILKKGPTILSFYWYETPGNKVGHSVILLSMSYDPGTGYIAYFMDPNSEDLQSMTISLFSFYGKPLSDLYFYSSANIRTLSYLDFDGVYNNIPISG